MKKRKTGRSTAASEVQAAETVPPRRSYRQWIALALCAALLLATWLSGGFAFLPRQMAERSLGRRDYAAAWWWMNAAEQLSHRDPANALLSARLARHEGDSERMQVEMGRARNWGAAPAAVRREELLSMAQSGRLEEIEGELMKLLTAEDGDEAEVSEAYANGLATLARFDDALSVLSAWREDFPNDPRPDHRIGRIQEHQQSYGDAEESYRRSLARDGGYFPARFSLGRVLLHQRKVEEAATEFRQCLEMPSPEAAQIELAIALKSMGKTDEARDLFQQVLAAPAPLLEASYARVEEQPEGFRAAAEYGKLEADAGNFAAAEPWLQKALEANPLDLLSRYSYAVTLRGLDKRQKAEQEFAKVAAARQAMDAAGALNARIKRDPRDLAARLELGKLVLEHESERTGLYWINSVFTYDPENVAAHQFLAEYYAQKALEDPSLALRASYHQARAAARPPASAVPKIQGPPVPENQP
jgi:tetratricopeptide (TPR) repeat protein